MAKERGRFGRETAPVSDVLHVVCLGNIMLIERQFDVSWRTSKQVVIYSAIR